MLVTELDELTDMLDALEKGEEVLESEELPVLQEAIRTSSDSASTDDPHALERAVTDLNRFDRVGLTMYRTQIDRTLKTDRTFGPTPVTCDCMRYVRDL